MPTSTTASKRRSVEARVDRHLHLNGLRWNGEKGGSVRKWVGGVVEAGDRVESHLTTLDSPSLAISASRSTESEVLVARQVPAGQGTIALGYAWAGRAAGGCRRMGQGWMLDSASVP